jgi:putative DNA primase/helicase
MKTATVDAATLAGDIAHRCERATYHAAGASWSACCPAHDDRHASLSISWDQDKVLLHCHAGCGTAAIVQALGLTMADLFVASPGRRNGKSPIVHVYDYVDLHGQLVHQTVRYAPKAFRQRRPDPAKPGDYLWNLRDIEPVLFHLPLVRAAVHRADTIYLVEGEKDAETQ